ncbi:bifunctional adenosylcobinamide kinase/adenosylcobinamide-phosphate guanylyltransferase [Rhodovibrio sodomensis]|uniref:Bifunctional adenosylcobalamin biosynthesis protein n=1 Tax=Rhodovibrio sodomensis TaxID=1088 RepID=A0ABS1DBL1_9PROT|nr:bifunctional adenosylcobinamide kinase/adenosylcobinamide-phosphate guanylyltransferase [Rhodovibrio sodomensis]MBK1667843.1 bifunctional adenosylcobinamide kinase/adenosylcobinamide-phosphate guanylyltransferase [Rhodovibrio sodomensis]
MTAPTETVRATLVLGGQRSGKSAYAERLVEAQPGACVYLATAEAHDSEMARRIAEHRARRGSRWSTVEAPLDLPGALAHAAGPERTVLVDCLTLWLSNLLGHERDAAAERARLCDALAELRGPAVLVSNEVGQGVIPDNKLARVFADEAGRLHQAVAAVAGRVLFVTAGLPQTLKDTAHT